MNLLIGLLLTWTLLGAPDAFARTPLSELVQLPCPYLLEKQGLHAFFEDQMKLYAPRVRAFRSTGIEWEGLSSVTPPKSSGRDAEDLELAASPILNRIRAWEQQLKSQSDARYEQYLSQGRVALDRDGTIASSAEFGGVELKSNRCDTRENVDYFWMLFEDLKNRSMILAEPGSSGVHTHIDFEPHLPGSQARAAILARVMNILHPLLTRKVSPGRQGFTQRIPKSYLRATVSESSAESFLERLLALGEELDAETFLEEGLLGQRWTILNLLALNRFGTVEFRILNSTLELPVMRSYVEFSQAIVRAIDEKDRVFLNYIAANAASPNLEVIWGLLKLTGPIPF